MKIQLVSDLHMEFAPITIKNAGADVLVLSGDITVADYFKRSETSPKWALADYWRYWFEDVCAEFDKVIYVMGNHEHYNGRFDDTRQTLSDALDHIPNLYILDNQTLDVGDVRFVGTTLWTDFNRDSMGAKLTVQSQLNDYHSIKRVRNGNYMKLRPNDTLFYHYDAIKLIDRVAQEHDKVIVVGHHAPSFKSVAPKYKDAGLLNYGYYSDLERFMFDRPSIKLWTHGHIHSSSDYYIGDTHIVANPRGYAHKNKPDTPENPDFNPNLILEI